MTIQGLELYAPEIFAHMKLVANSIWESGRVQKPWIKNPQTVLLVMQKGYDLGMSPLAALDHLTQFRDEGAWGISISGAKGLVAAKGGTITIVTDTDAVVAVKVTRKDWADHQEVVKLEECEKSGVMMSSKGKKEVWVKFPRAMLRATAIRRALTHMWSDVLVGCSPFDPEVETEDEGTVIEATPEDNKPRKTRRTKAEMEQDALATPDVTPPVDPGTGNAGITISTPTEPVVIPKTEDKPAEPNPFENPLAKAEEPKAEAFDLGKMNHRMILIEAIKSCGFNADQIKKCKEQWADSKWPKDHGIVATIESITQGLKDTVK